MFMLNFVDYCTFVFFSIFIKLINSSIDLVFVNLKVKHIVLEIEIFFCLFNIFIIVSQNISKVKNSMTD